MIPNWIRNISGQRELKQVAEFPIIAHYSISGDGNEPNTILTLTPNREDLGWNNAEYTGAPNHVKITALCYYNQPSNNAYQRIAPMLELLKNGAVVARSATGYQRHASGHDSSSNTISYLDPNPGTNPVYQLRAQQESTQNDVLNVDLGHFSLEAIN